MSDEERRTRGRSPRRPIVALVGRPNVGKSALFNRIVGQRMAVVHEEPGTTRDRLYATTEWNGLPFVVVDTGGLEATSETAAAGRRPAPESASAQDSAPYIPMMRAQAETAIREADAVIFVTDGINGLTAGDEEVAHILYRAECPVFLAVNKADNLRLRQDTLEFYALGLGEVYPISALHGIGVADLLDEVVETLRCRVGKEPEPEHREGPSPGPKISEERAKFAIVGRPNVGKSSLLNRLLGEERVIVSPIPGTTRDAIDTFLEWDGTPITLIDTAGMRGSGKGTPDVEYYSVLRALRAIRRADVALLMIDGFEGVTAQDKHIADFVLDEWVSVVVLVNKWDAVEKDARTMEKYTRWVREAFRFLDFVPVLFISALTGQRVKEVVPTALAVREARLRRLATDPLNRVVQEAVAHHAPPSKRGRRLRIHRVSQTGVDPPAFTFHVNDPDLVDPTYERYLENRLRETYEFTGTPLRLTFRPGERRGTAGERDIQRVKRGG